MKDTPFRKLACVVLGGSLAHAGTLSATPLGPGDLVVSEFLANPDAVSDATGEWLELFNPTPAVIDLTDVVLGDDGGDNHAIAGGAPLPISPGGYVLLARSGDPARNGGIAPDYVYSGFTLGNSGDEILLRHGSDEIFRLEYGAAFAPAGTSIELRALPADYAATPATLIFGAGDVGTPGGQGSVALAASLPPAAVSPPHGVPAPPTAWLLGAGLLGLAWRGRSVERRRHPPPAGTGPGRRGHR